MPPVQNFVRAEMLPSGYLIRPCEGGGSIIHIVDHMNMEVKSSHHVYVRCPPDFLPLNTINLGMLMF